MDRLPRSLRAILREVSRSFSLSLAVLPASLRGPLGLAYLLARAADSIADTRILPRGERLRCLDLFRRELDAPALSGLPQILAAVRETEQHPSERALLARLPECFTLYSDLASEDRGRVASLLGTLVHGMRVDLERFPGDCLVALKDRAELDEYTYYAAGCVGEFWTAMAIAHRPALGAWDPTRMAGLGRRFGQGLQMTNVLRDLAQDLRLGRCYLPREDLARLRLAPEDLLRSDCLLRLRPLLAELVGRAVVGHADGWSYLQAIPRTEARLRLACAWPMLIGLCTLEQIGRSPALLDPAVRVKISRPAVYGILARSTLLVRWDAGLGRYYGRLRDRAGGMSFA
jgi:farnesyl-diphosphate farnesyltransferase